MSHTRSYQIQDYEQVSPAAIKDRPHEKSTADSIASTIRKNRKLTEAMRYEHYRRDVFIMGMF